MRPRHESTLKPFGHHVDLSIIIVITYGPMKANEAITALSALAHEHRLTIFRLLIEQGPEGLPAGVIAEKVGLQPSSLTFHLQHLTRAGLLVPKRASRQIFYAADFVAMNSLVSYLTENCCTAPGASCSTECQPAVTESKRTARNKRSA
jgi:ArsR family transcriptional regulator, arsenate/arsenite/antimonite-responsive transcriptional repressor